MFLKTGCLHLHLTLTSVILVTQDNLFLYYLQVTGVYLKPSQTFMMELFCENS